VSATRIVDSTRFVVEGVWLDWLQILKGKGITSGPLVDAFVKGGKARYAVALRWHLAAHHGNLQNGKDQGIGLPTGPFTVWRRPSLDTGLEKPVGFDLVGYALLGVSAIRFDRRLAMARVQVTHPTGTVIFGITNPEWPWSTVTQATVPAGSSQVELYAPGMAGILIADGTTVSKVTGVSDADYHGVANWQPVEIVGLPVDPKEWAGVGDHAQYQGLLPALEEPRTAAAHRLQRGTPVLGWDPLVAAGVSAPPWAPPDPLGVLAELDPVLLPSLHDLLVKEQMAQALETLAVPLPPPATLDGDEMPADPSTAQVSPVSVLQLGVGTDPYLSLALGYGTNLDETGRNPDVPRFHGGSLYDYMVTAPYAKGLDGKSPPVELVAYALRPLPAAFPPVPVQLDATHRAFEAPAAVDLPWAASTIVRWERPTKTTLFRLASSALARHDAGDATAVALMESRTAGGFHPVAPGQSPTDAENNFLHLTDTRAVIPNDPGARSMRYSVANQNLFGLWSGWRGADHAVTQPAPVPPRIVSATLELPAPPSGKLCTGGLLVDFTWDWTDRRPDTVELLGTLYPAATRGAPPPSNIVPSGLDRTPGGGQPSVVLQFTGDTATVDGVVTNNLRYLNQDGDEEVAPGATQSDSVRRYRLTVPGFSVDFTGTPHAGVALWVRGTERLAPHHQTEAAGPVLAFASDPVAPPMSPPIVTLGSMPDAQGRSHAKLAWTAVAGAAGYLVYEADEFTLLHHYEQAEPAPDAALSNRLQTIKDLFDAHPGDRRPFTRLTSRPVTGTSLDVMLPRGSRSIQCYVIITAGPGATEGPWPSNSDALYAIAAPRIAAPPPPELLAVVDEATGVVTVTVRTRTGHAVEQVDVHRVSVDDAARSLATMGPPIATVTSGGGGGWTWKTPAKPADPAYGTVTVSGSDSPGPSWRRVWYRALAWGAPNDARGLVRGPSAPSNPFSLVVPPAAAPDLSSVSLKWPGGAVADVRLDFSSAAPVARTALGPHRLEIALADVTDPSAPAVVLSLASDLEGLPTAAPASGNGVWRVSGTPTGYRVIVRRNNVNVVLRGLIRLVDPLGRRSEQPVDVPAGQAPP
jgi:hypothetical protein